MGSNPFASLASVTSKSWSLCLDSSAGNTLGAGIGLIVQGIADVHQCLRVLFGTVPGEDPFRRTFGCDLTKYMDMPISIASPAIVSEVSDAIARWEPRITVESISARYVLNELGKLEVTIVWQPNLGGTPATKTVIGQQTTVLAIGQQAAALLVPPIVPPGPPAIPLPIHFWPMNEGSGLTLFDIVGKTPLSTTNVTWVNTTGLGVVANFNGANSVAAPPTYDPTLDFNGLTPFSVSFWINPSLIPVARVFPVITNLDPNHIYRGWEISLEAGFIALTLIQVDNTQQLSGEAMCVNTANQNYFITITYDGQQLPSSIRIYLNGVYQPVTIPNNSLTPGVPITSNVPTSVGGGGDGWFGGAICYLRVWDLMLTPDQVTALTALGVA